MDQSVGSGHITTDQRMQTLDRRNAGSSCLVFDFPCHCPRDYWPGAGQGKRYRRHTGLYNSRMKAVLKTNDPVLLSFATNVLEQEGVGHAVFDENASIMDGSAGFLPRRLMVMDEDFQQAQRLLRGAVPGAFDD